MPTKPWPEEVMVWPWMWTSMSSQWAKPASISSALFGIVGAEVLHGLVGEDDAPAERVARIVALEHDDVVPRVAQLHGDGEDETGGSAADAGDAHELVYI